MANIRRSRAGGFIRAGRSRRETFWIDMVPTSTTISAASSAVLFGGFSADILALRPFTVIRTRAVMGIASDQAAGSEFQQARFGIAIVSEQALAIGVTAVPTPDTDASSDLWFVFHDMVSRMEVSSAIRVWMNSTPSMIDSKAMRKVEDGQDFATVFETTAASAGVRVSKQGRLLIKLH